MEITSGGSPLHDAVVSVGVSDAAEPAASWAYSDRSCTPEETLKRIEPLLARFGITRLSRLTTLDNNGIPVWNAVVPNSRSIVINQGKGITDIDAKVSAAMEALERAVACAPRVQTTETSWKALAEAGEAVEPLPCLIGARQEDVGYEDRMEWIRGLDPMTGGDVFVPFEAVALDRTKPCRFWQSSDGLASGNTPKEAILHGLLERIERDAHVLWQVTSTSAGHRRCVDPLFQEDPVVTSLTERLQRAGLMLRLFDITSDIGIPCYSALLAPADILERKHPRFLDATHGSGAHPSPVRAMIRAITEAAQSRLTFISGARDDIDPAAFEQPLPETTRRSLRAEPQRVRHKQAVPVSGAEALLAFTLERLKAAGIDRVIAVPLTGDDLPFCVAKVLVPQLENPEGERKRRFGERAISRSLGVL
jgi:ribosomal protein S12 methylthiotransferase accessory factor